MIQVDSITIKDFRGIRDLTLNLNRKHFAICGPNGTGKSGVVDALEFALTGNISRLSGEGKGEVSVKHHGPHVDLRNNPDKARVKLTLTIPTLGKTVTLERSVKTPAIMQVVPNDADVRTVLLEVQRHPEIVLSRRELIRYVLATPGERAREVQALLQLDRIEQARVGLQKIANAAEKQVPSFIAYAKTAMESLLRALEITELTAPKLIGAANVHRSILGLPALAELTATTSIKDGLSAPIPAKAQLIPKAQAMADIQAARDLLAEVVGAPFAAKVADVSADVTALAAEPAAASGAAIENFYTAGISLIEAEACPLCDTSWDPSELRAKVQAKVERLKEFSRKRKAIERKVLPLSTLIGRTKGAIETLIRHGALAKPPVNLQAVADYSAVGQRSISRLNALIPLSETLATLESLAVVPPKVLESIADLHAVVAALPEPNKQDAARETLTLAQERLEVYREAMRRQKIAKEKAVLARQVFTLYATTSDKALSGLYEKVQKDFATLYSFINRDDEKGFSAKLEPSMGKLGFDVDFYGRGFFPPGAYHSEGHQDGMGLCLYLALMRHIQGAGFTLAVLDDVLMSVDTGHRREVCSLLKKEFPNTQFIITTHDPVWLRLMRTVGLISGKSGVQFRTWTVDQGPMQWDDRDVWAEIDGHLSKNDVRSAAGLLRNFLEYAAAELCHGLRAPVEFRSDGQYQLGELLPTAAAQLRKLYRSAKTVAEGWKQSDIVAALATKEADFGKLVATSQMEQWQVNSSIHFNAWANFSKEDFTPVVKAYRELIEGFAAPDCHEPLYVSPDRESAESLRCDCGRTNINLKKK